MSARRLQLLYLSQFPPSPPTYGAQRRIAGLLAALAKSHDVTAVAVISPDLNAAEAERSMRSYCKQVVLVPGRPWAGMGKRLLQVRALLSKRSFEHHFFNLRPLRPLLQRLLSQTAFDVVNVEHPFLAHLPLRQAPPGAPLPVRVLDEHNIEFDLARQQANSEHGLVRRIHNATNWPKIRAEEVEAFQAFDGVTFCSEADEERARTLVPNLRSAVVPNAVDVQYFQPSSALPPSDGRTVLFFGAINYFPNVDGLLYLLRDVWPLVEKRHPEARLKIVGQHPTPEILAFRGPKVEVTGKVEDVRVHLSQAAVTVVPLRVGGGTRFKILEAMAMGRPVVSTSLGAEGISARPGADILLADEPVAFAEAVGRVLETPALAAQLGAAGRALVERHYSWDAAGGRLERFFLECLERRASPVAAARSG
ncbi:MAG: glycosyltransferase family 4 protein [Myxococcaceae bacterium]